MGHSMTGGLGMLYILHPLHISRSTMLVSHARRSPNLYLLHVSDEDRRYASL